MNPKRHNSRTLSSFAVAALAILLFVSIHAPRVHIAEASNDSPQTVSSIASRLNKLLVVPKSSRLELSAQVIELPSGRVLYDHNGHRPLIPASNMKLIVMAAAIDRLGTDYKYQTVLAIRDMDLVVIGSGDPTLGDPEIARSRGQTITSLFHRWAKALKDAGIAQIPGNIIVDDLIFDLHFTHPHWPRDQYQKWYEAPVGGLNFNDNCVQAAVAPTQPGQPGIVSFVPDNTFMKIKNKTVTGKKNRTLVARPRHSDTLVVSGTVATPILLQEVTVQDPGLFFGSVLKSVLQAEGIAIGGKVVRERIRLDNGRLPMNCHILDVHRSVLAQTLARCGKNSMGMMAEALFKTLGASQSGLGTWESGRSAVHEFLRSSGVPAGEIAVDDGSGLSRKNQLSAAAATRVLKHVFHSGTERFGLLKDSLSIAGTDGTLAKRMKQADIKGRLFGKTGTLNGVRTLEGYIHTQSGTWLAFAFFYNYSGSMPDIKHRMDRACRVLVCWPDSVTSQPKATRSSSSRG